MSVRVRTVFFLLLAAALAGIGLYAHLGMPKAPEQWKWVDILGEGGTALMSALWALLVLGSRPGGRVTSLLVGGLLAITLGSWADCLDEFFALPSAERLDNWLEALVPAGMLALTAGLYFWRLEQFSLNEHMQKRERLFRDHRSFDRLTQFAGADYLRRQITLEQARNPDGQASLALLDIDAFHRINREHGQAEGDRLLQAVAHLLLLNLRTKDLLCRYAGDRFAVLLPDTPAAEAERLVAHLQRAVASLAHHTRQGKCLRISVRTASAPLAGEPEALLASLDERLEGGAQALAALA